MSIENMEPPSPEDYEAVDANIAYFMGLTETQRALLAYWIIHDYLKMDIVIPKQEKPEIGGGIYG